MRIVFAGTPDAAVPSLRHLTAAGHDVRLVLTRPDAPVGRKRVLTPSPVAREAETLGLQVLKTNRLDDAATARVGHESPQLGVIVAYGGLVREPLLSLPERGWINLHFSLLPRWRGAAPVQHAVMAGDPEVGANVFQLTAGLDEGDIIAEVRMPLPPETTAGELLIRLADAGASLLTDAVGKLESGTAAAREQAGQPSFAPKLSDIDGRIDWSQPQDRVRAHVNGVTPEPGAVATLDDKRVKLLAVDAAPSGAPRLSPGELRGVGGQLLVGTGSAPLVLVRVQPAGRSAMTATDWWRGMRINRARFDLPALDAQTPGQRLDPS